jgi:hypothetical protein
MIRKPVKGKKVRCYIYKVDGYYPVACLTNVRLWITEQVDDTSTPDSGRYVTLKPAGVARWGIDLTTVTVLEDLTETLYFTWEFFIELVRTNGVNVKVVVEDVVGNQKVYAGFCYTPQLEISGNAEDDWSNGSIQLLGSGEITFTDTLTPNIPKVIRIPWVATAEQKIFQDNRLIGKLVADIKHVSAEGNDIWEIIDAGSISERQVKLDNVTGSIEFLNGRDVNDYVYLLVE